VDQDIDFRHLRIHRSQELPHRPAVAEVTPVPPERTSRRGDRFFNRAPLGRQRGADTDNIGPRFGQSFGDGNASAVAAAGDQGGFSRQIKTGKRTHVDSGFRDFRTLAGTPPMMVKGGTSRVTTAPAARIDPVPTVTPAVITTRPPTHTSSSIRMLLCS